MTKLTTVNFKTNVINELIQSITETPNTEYYMFAGEHVNRTVIPPPAPEDMVSETLVDAYRKMSFGKRITPTDVAPMIRNIPYQSEYLFTMYDDQDADLFDSDYYCVVDESSFYHVYKCLDNNLGANSTIEPVFAHITGANTIVYQTSDGYRWKYMYSIPLADYEQFATENYVPVYSNSTVSDAAVYGSIDVIKIELEGKNYNNYMSGSFTAADVRYNGNSTLYRVSNNNISLVNGYYTDTLIYISAGTGAGQYKTVSDYFTDSNGSFVVVNSVFTTPPENGSSWDINPRVDIVGSGIETVNAVARCLINASSTNSIYRVEMLNRGVGYDFATATATANDVVGISSVAQLRPIFPPKNGHGFDPAPELGSKWVTFGINFSNTESNTIIAQSDYQKIGILKDPLFANVQIEYKNRDGTFIANELISVLNPIYISANATINSTSNTLSLTIGTGNFQNQISVGDAVYLAGSNGTVHQITNVQAVTNNDVLELESVGLFACTETIVYLANTSTEAYIVTTANTTDMFVTNVAGVLSTDDYYIGWASGAQAQVNAISRNGLAKGFDTFVQLYKYDTSSISGTFIEDEYVTQGDKEGRLHSVVTNSGISSIYVSDQIGAINTASALVGNTSLATATLSEAYSPELVFGSGDVLYLENIDPVTRSNTQSETFKITFEF